MYNEQRVQRIKRAIYAFIVLLFFLPFVIMIILLTMMISRVDELNSQLKNSQHPVVSQELSQEISTDSSEQVIESSASAEMGYVLEPQMQVSSRTNAPDNSATDRFDEQPGGASSDETGSSSPQGGGTTNDSPANADGGSPQDVSKEYGASSSVVMSEEDTIPSSSSSPEVSGSSPSGDLPPTGNYTANTFVPTSYTSLLFDTIPQPTQQPARTVYLSFDNTPNLYTQDILSVLDKHGVKASFFVWGNGTDDLYRQIVNNGHSIGIHSYSNSMTYPELYASVNTYLDDFSVLFNRIYETTGVRTRLYRLPGGSVQSHIDGRQTVLDEITQTLGQRGFLQHDWSVSAQDAVYPPLSTEQIVENLRSSLNDSGHVVVLLHDGTGETTVEALDEFISRSLAEGYAFEALDYDTVPVSFIDNK